MFLMLKAIINRLKNDLYNKIMGLYLYLQNILLNKSHIFKYYLYEVPFNFLSWCRPGRSGTDNIKSIEYD
jgi:hypothetical protein